MGKKALVVDDTSYIRMDIRKLLEEQGYEVYEAIDGIDGVEKYKSINPDIVTMDVNMPKIHGLKATQLITDYDSEAKVMMCSTMMSFQNYIKMAEQAGAKGFLSKPFSSEDFFDELARLFL